MVGTHFPMSPIVCATLHDDISGMALANAVMEVNQRFPQFRLGYRLDSANDRLVRVAESELKTYLAALVQVMALDDRPLTDVLAVMMSENITPISQPIAIVMYGPHIAIKFHHSFGDGRFLFHLMATLLLALLKPDDFRQLPDLPAHYALPMWRIVYQSPGQALRVFTKWIKTLRGTVQEYQRDMSGTPAEMLDPIRSGTPMRVVFKRLSPDAMLKLATLRTKLSAQEKISVNTLLEVLFAQVLHDMGLVRPPVMYTVPVDLHRYLNQPDAFYPGNLSGQIRISGQASFDLQQEVTTLQKHISEQLETLIPLSTLPSEWLLMLAGKKTYKSVNRGWLNASINTDPRFFVLSNLGTLDKPFSALVDCLDLSEGLFVTVPLMGGPHLVITITTLQGQGNIAVTFDPRVLTDAHIDSLFEGLEHALAD